MSFWRDMHTYSKELQGYSAAQITESMRWFNLTLPEAWCRFVVRTWLGKRVFPKTAFLLALDNPPEPIPTKCTGPR